MVVMGTLHFVSPEPFVAIMPAILPAPLLLVYVSGVFEILGGFGLAPVRTRRMAAWGLIALFVAIFPANVNMAVNQLAIGGHVTPPWVLWARLPLQAVLIWWAWRYTRPVPEVGAS